MAREFGPEEQFRRDQSEMLDALTVSGRWQEIIPQMFPNLPKPLVEHAREVAIDERTKYLIETRIPQLETMGKIFSEDEKTSREVFEQLLECKNEMKEMIEARDKGDMPEEVTNEMLRLQIENKLESLQQRLQVYSAWANLDMQQLGFGVKGEERAFDRLSNALVDQTKAEIELLSKQLMGLLKLS